MARCGCGGACACSLIAGSNTTVTGSGTAANPWVINATSDCATVRTCISAGPGINYNSGTGVVSADVSSTAGNTLVIDANGLFVPPGTNTVVSGCGIQGNGSAGSPLAIEGKAWSFGCAQSSATAMGVYCDPATGLAHGDPPFKFATAESNLNEVLAPVDYVTVPAAETTIRTMTVTITNPDPCRNGRLIFYKDVDMDLTMPPNSVAMYGIDGDDTVQYENRTASTIVGTHWQASKVGNSPILAPGASTTLTYNLTAGFGSNGATITRIQAAFRVWVWSVG